MVGKPARYIARHELHFCPERKGEIGHLVSSREIHENRDFEIRYQVQEEILKFVFFGPIEGELTEYDAADVAQQASSSEMQESFVGDRHGVARFFEKENGVAGIDLVWSADGLLHQREISPCESTNRPAGPHRTRNLPAESGAGVGRGQRVEKG